MLNIGVVETRRGKHSRSAACTVDWINHLCGADRQVYPTIATYNARGPFPNAIPILNEDVFDRAAESDARTAAGKLRGPLDGIPYTLKDSMKYKGMTCSTGSPALEDVVANEDSFVAEQLRKADAT